MNIYDIDKINSEMSMFAKASDLEKLVHDTTQKFKVMERELATKDDVSGTINRLKAELTQILKSKLAIQEFEEARNEME